MPNLGLTLCKKKKKATAYELQFHCVINRFGIRSEGSCRGTPWCFTHTLAHSALQSYTLICKMLFCLGFCSAVPIVSILQGPAARSHRRARPQPRVCLRGSWPSSSCRGSDDSLGPFGFCWVQAAARLLRGQRAPVTSGEREQGGQCPGKCGLRK